MGQANRGCPRLEDDSPSLLVLALLISRMLSPDPQSCLSLRAGHTGSEPANDVEPVRMFWTEEIRAVLQLACHGDGHPEVVRRGAQARELGFRNADHWEGMTANHDGLSDDRGVATEFVLPGRVTEHDNRGRSSRASVFWEQCPPGCRSHIQHAEVVGRDQLARQRVALHTPEQTPRADDFGKCRITISQGLEFWP